MGKYREYDAEFKARVVGVQYAAGGYTRLHIKKRADRAMMEPKIEYDETSDTLYVSFAPGERATGIELNEHVLLRISKAERRPIGLTIFEYSLLAQVTEMGVRSFPLTGLKRNNYSRQKFP